MKKMYGYTAPKIVGMFFLFLGFVALMGLATMLLWNWLVPVIFAGPEITWVQALGLLLLAKILTGGPGRGWGGHHRGGGHWRRRWEKKWANMSPEQREKMKAHWGHHCGHSHCGHQHEKPAEGNAETAPEAS